MVILLIIWGTIISAIVIIFYRNFSFAIMKFVFDRRWTNEFIRKLVKTNL